MADTAFHLFPEITPTGPEVIPVDNGVGARRITVASISTFALTNPVMTGPVTTEGVDIITPYDMPALAINVAKKVNRKTLTVDSTLSLSATMTTNSLLVLKLTNGVATGIVVTHPSAYDVNKQATSTSFVLPGSISVTLLLEYDGTTLRLSGTPSAMNNTTATTDPTVTDDSADGYGATSMWINTTAGRAFVCRAAPVGAAVWSQITGSIPAGTPRTITAAATLGATDINTTLVYNAAATGALTVPADATLGITGAKVGNSAIVVYIQGAGVPTFTASGSTINGSPRAGLATNDTIVLNHTGIANTWSYA